VARTPTGSEIAPKVASSNDACGDMVRIYEGIYEGRVPTFIPTTGWYEVI